LLHLVGYFRIKRPVYNRKLAFFLLKYETRFLPGIIEEMNGIHAAWSANWLEFSNAGLAGQAQTGTAQTGTGRQGRHGDIMDGKQGR